MPFNMLPLRGSYQSRYYLDFINSNTIAMIEYDPLRPFGKHTRRVCVADASKLDELQDFCDEQNRKLAQEYAERLASFTNGGKK